MNDLFDSLPFLKESVGVFEMYQISKFKCYRRIPNGETEELDLEVWDAGPGSADRYDVVVTRPDGKQTSGNGGPTIEAALAVVHWNKLDE